MKGITLIEVLVVALIASIIGLGVISVLSSSTRLTNDGFRKVMLMSNTNRLMDAISSDVRNGVLLESSGDVLSIADRDSNITSWTVEEDAISRNGSEFLMIGTDNVTFNNLDSIFNVNVGGVGAYHKVNVEFDISLVETSGTLTIPTIRNSFYTRTDHTGIGW